MSHYARNHLQDDWATQSLGDSQTRLQAAEHAAGWYFDQATKRQRAEFEATMRALLGMTGPRANRARDCARARWHVATAEARALLDVTIECLLESGEVSTDLDERWTALIDRDARTPMAAE